MRVHHLNNVNNALQILRDYRIKLVNINNNDIVDGNPKLTLGLVWSIILHWQVSDAAWVEWGVGTTGASRPECQQCVVCIPTAC